MPNLLTEYKEIQIRGIEILIFPKYGLTVYVRKFGERQICAEIKKSN